MKKFVKLSKAHRITEDINKHCTPETPERAEEVKQNVTLEIISQQVDVIRKNGCSGLQCSQCCLKKRCNRTPERGQELAVSLWAHSHSKQKRNK